MLLVLLAIVSLLLALPTVQTKLANSANSYLQNEFDVDINLQKIDLTVFGKINIKDVLIKDHHADTLIYVQNLKSSLYSFRKVLDNKMEFGEISLQNFILNIRTYKGEEDDALTVFVDKFGTDTVSDSPSSFKLFSDLVVLDNGYVEVVDDNSPEDEPIFFDKISGEADDLKIIGPNVNVLAKNLSFIENHGIEAKNLSSDFGYTKTTMQFLNTQLETENSTVSADIYFKYDRENLSDFNNKVNIEGEITKADISLIDLRKYYDEIGTDDVLHLTSKFSGQLNNLQLKDLKIKTDKKAIIEGAILLKNSFNTENGFSLDANLTNLTSDYVHLKTLLPNLLGKNLPSSFKELGRFKVKGNVYVTENLINFQTEINTDIGTVITDLELANIQNIDKALYIGHIEVIDLEFGKIINNPLVGLLSMEADVDGEGFTLDKINTSVKGIVTKHQYKNYTYSNISINGIIKNRNFNGEMEVNDDNIKLNFNGLADLSSNIFTFNFKTTVDYCDLYKLNLFKRDSISNLKGLIEINLKGNSLDNLVGEINFKNSLYTNQKGDYFFKDFAITSTIKDSVRTVNINSSEIVKGKFKGKFKLDELGKLFQNSVGSIYSHYQPFEVEPNQNLNFSLEVYNKIIDVFLPEVALSANTFINGKIDSDRNLFQLNIKSPKIVAYQTTIDSVNLQVDNKNPLFNTQLLVKKITSKYYTISDLHLLNKTLNDTLYFGTNFKGGKNKTEEYNLSFYHTFTEDNKSVVGIQKSNFVFKNIKWFINPEDNNENKVAYNVKSKQVIFSPFLIASKEQSINFSGEINDSISKDLKIDFKNVNLADITPNIDSLSIEGIINGTINYSEFENQIKPEVNLTISNFNINDSEQGNLYVKFEGKNSVKQYVLDISLDRPSGTNFTAFGEIDLSTQAPTLDVSLEFNEFKLDAFSPLGEDVFNKIRGFAYGDVHLTGLLSNPTMDGELYLDEAGLAFPYLNVDYDFMGTSVITLKDQTFTFEDVTIRDKAYKTKADLSGTLSHKYFETWDLDLTVATNNLLVLNTAEDEFALYYGKAFFDGAVTIKGPTDKLVIDVNGKTNKNTHFIMPLSDVKTAEASQLIRFVSTKNQIQKEKIRKAFISEKLKGMSINFDLEVTKDAIFEMVVDLTSGSYLRGSGTGNIQIELDTKDKFEMYGDFIVDNGVYDFKYGGIISKPFRVRKGGSISWNGDPLTAEINIEAIHRVSANPKVLLENISSTRKIPIDLVTRFSGELFDSSIEFDIEIPNSSSTVTSELEFKLNNNKNTQFISLLVTGSFVDETNSGFNSNSALYGTGMDMITNAFDNIFNSVDSKLRVTTVYTIGENNEVDNLDISDQLAFAMDYQVNDRVIINGKVGVPIGADQKSNIIGEVTVEFLMNESGSFRSSVFNRQNEIQYTEEEEGYTQGIGLSYQIDFDNGRELLEKLSLKKKKTTDSIQTKKEIDTISQKLVNFKNKKNSKNE